MLARRSGSDVHLEETACLAIVLTAEAQGHEYAVRGQVKRVAERTGDVCELARSLFYAAPDRV